MTYNFDDEEESDGFTIWLAYWCNEGLEAIINISDYIEREKEELFQVLKTGEEPDRNSKRELSAIMASMSMRARLNGQRHYEMYTFSASSHISEETIREWFETSPQSAVSWIRKNGSGLIKKNESATKPVID